MTTPRLLIGPYGNGLVGLKAAFSGFDVTNTADDGDFDKRSFNSASSSPLVKVAQVGVASVTGQFITTVPHSLGYAPYFEARDYSSDGTTATVFDDRWLQLTSTVAANAVHAWCSSSSLQMQHGITVGTVLYVIWRQPLG
jgi:hypothetical protein